MHQLAMIESGVVVDLPVLASRVAPSRNQGFDHLNVATGRSPVQWDPDSTGQDGSGATGISSGMARLTTEAARSMQVFRHDGSGTMVQARWFRHDSSRAMVHALWFTHDDSRAMTRAQRFVHDGSRTVHAGFRKVLAFRESRLCVSALHPHAIPRTVPCPTRLKEVCMLVCV